MANEQTTDPEAALRLFQTHITRNADGTFALGAQDAASIGIDGQLFTEMKLSLERTNGMIRACELDPEEVKFVFWDENGTLNFRKWPPG